MIATPRSACSLSNNIFKSGGPIWRLTRRHTILFFFIYMVSDRLHGIVKSENLKHRQIFLTHVQSHTCQKCCHKLCSQKVSAWWLQGSTTLNFQHSAPRTSQEFHLPGGKVSSFNTMAEVRAKYFFRNTLGYNFVCFHNLQRPCDPSVVLLPVQGSRKKKARLTIWLVSSLIAPVTLPASSQSWDYI